jgi:hypothetical protein
MYIPITEVRHNLLAVLVVKCEQGDGEEQSPMFAFLLCLQISVKKKEVKLSL